MDIKMLLVVTLTIACGVPLQGGCVGAARRVPGTPLELPEDSNAPLEPFILKLRRGMAQFKGQSEIPMISGFSLINSPLHEDSDMMALTKTFNQRFNSTHITSIVGTLRKETPSFGIAAMWWSERPATSLHNTNQTTNKAHSSGPASLTAVTGLSLSRIPQLFAQCRSWPGPLSAVIYVPLIADKAGHGTSGRFDECMTLEHREKLLKAAVKIVYTMVQLQGQEGVCQLDMMLVYEMLDSQEAAAALYPVNALRNMARLQARTPLVMVLDADLIVHKGLHERLQDHVQVQSLIEQSGQKKSVFILPAFVGVGGTMHEMTIWADEQVNGVKETLLRGLSQGKVALFDHPWYPQGHRNENMTLWRNASCDYTVPYEIGLGLPWHDERYRGYGRNKIQWVLDVATHNFTFKVLHDTYTIHRPHPMSHVSKAFRMKQNQTQVSKDMKTFVKELFNWQVHLHKSGKVWAGHLNPGTRAVLQSVPWWSVRQASSPANSQSEQEAWNPPTTNRKECAHDGGHDD